MCVGVTDIQKHIARTLHLHVIVCSYILKQAMCLNDLIGSSWPLSLAPDLQHIVAPFETKQWPSDSHT